jgi:hypothetical protein
MTTLPRRHRFTVEEYYQLAAGGRAGPGRARRRRDLRHDAPGALTRGVRPPAHLFRKLAAANEYDPPRIVRPPEQL